MKRLITFLIIAVMLFGISSCGLTPADSYSILGNDSGDAETEKAPANNNLLSMLIGNKAEVKPEEEPLFSMSLSLVSPLSIWDRTRLYNIQSLSAEGNIGFYQRNSEKLNGQVDYIQGVLKNEKIDLLVVSPMYIELEDNNWDGAFNLMDMGKTKVIAIDNISNIKPGTVDALLGHDYAGQGEIAAEWINENVGNAKVIVVSKSLDIMNESVNKSFENALDGDILSLEMSDGSRKGVSESLAKTLKGEDFSGVNVIFAQSEDIAIGAIQAIKEKELKPGKDIIIVSIGSSKTALSRLKSGEINCVIKTDPTEFARVLMQLAEDVVADNDYEKKTLIKAELIEKKDVADELKNASY